MGMKQAHDERLPDPWNREAAFTRLLMKDCSLNGSARFHKPDLWHSVHLGVGKAWAASSLLLLASKMGGRNIDAKFEIINSAFVSFCKANKLTKYISKVDKHMCGGGGSNEAIGTWSKASVTTNLCLFIEDFCKLHPDIVDADERVQLIAAFLYICFVLFLLPVFC